MRAVPTVMPGYVKYHYKNGFLPTHTKSAFKNYSILIVQSIFARNALIFMSKVLRLTSDMPRSIIKLIQSTFPSHDASHEASPEWIYEYGSAKYKNSVFLKARYCIVILSTQIQQYICCLP